MKTLSFTLLVLLLVSTAFSAPLYNLIDLGTIPAAAISDYMVSEAYSINNNGQIVGCAYGRVNAIKAVLFDSTGGGNNINLGEPSKYSYSEAYYINNNGQIVGRAGQERATLFDITGAGNNIDLGTIPDYDYSRAYSINNHGQIVGYSYIPIDQYEDAPPDSRDAYRATLFDSTGNGNNIDLGGGIAYSINDNGQIVGYGAQAILFDSTGSGNNIDLGTLPGFSSSKAYSINNNSLIVGASGNRAILFDITGAGNNIDLGYGVAYSINNNGQIVGESGDRAMLFDITGAGNNIDLNTLIDPAIGWKLQEARCINDNGWIVGQGINPDGQGRAFLLTPVPEPASALLIGIGLIFVRLKRKHH